MMSVTAIAVSSSDWLLLSTATATYPHRRGIVLLTEHWHRRFPWRLLWLVLMGPVMTAKLKWMGVVVAVAASAAAAPML